MSAERKFNKVELAAVTELVSAEQDGPESYEKTFASVAATFGEERAIDIAAEAGRIHDLYTEN